MQINLHIAIRLGIGTEPCVCHVQNSNIISNGYSLEAMAIPCTELCGEQRTKNKPQEKMIEKRASL